MEWPFKKKKKGSFFDEDFLSAFFDNFEDEFERMTRDMDEVFRQFGHLPRKELKKRGIKVEGPYVYGFSMKIGPNGKPVIREFGNLPKMKEKGITNEREPLIDIIDKKNEICVIAEVPGVEKKDIDLQITNNQLVIDVKNPERKYHKIVDLPAHADEKKINATYKNGVLEVTIKKKKEKIKAKKIKID